MVRFLTAVIAVVMVVVPAAADDLIDMYVAHFSANDHINSKGARLRTAAHVIAQDRANYHRFGRADAIDEPDVFFTSVNRRLMAGAMLDRGSVSAQVRSDILDWEMEAQIEIWSGPSGPYLKIYILP